MSIEPTCTHGMPSPAACVDCMDEGPIVPLAKPRLQAARRMEARFPGRCAADDRHRIDSGDRIGYVELVGWCCASCAVEDGA